MVDLIAIRELKRKESTDVLWKTCCDVLRALTILHGSAWHLDLTFTLSQLWNLEELGNGQIRDLEEKIDDAIKALNESGIVSSQRRLRAVLSRAPMTETLHCADPIELQREFGGDKYVLRYRSEIMGY